MKVCVLSIIVGIALLFASASSPGRAAGRMDGSILVSAASKKSAAPRPREEGQIACTVSGCQRIPPNCHPETEYNWDGIPTGFDTVVCRPPRGRRG